MTITIATVKVMAFYKNFFKMDSKTKFTKIKADCESGSADKTDEISNNTKNNYNWKRKLLIGIVISIVVLFLVIVCTMCGYILSMVIQMAHNTCQNDTQSIVGLQFDYHQETIEPQIELSTSPDVLKLASGATVLMHPADQMVKPSEQLTIQCVFSQPVKCVWTRRSNTVDISGRYKYTDQQKGQTNNDCSISIESFRRLDIGEWQCIGVFDDQSTIATSTAKLSFPPTSQESVSNDIRLVDSPNDQKSAEGSAVTLQCRFNTPVECVWMRRGEHIEVKGRYSYVNPHQMQKTTDCSLTINQLKPIDDGQWVCSTMADSNSVGVMSKPINISLITR